MAMSPKVDDTIKAILTEAKKMSKEERQLLLKELKIRRLMASNKPIVKAKNVKPLSLKEIDYIKHLSRKTHAQ